MLRTFANWEPLREMLQARLPLIYENHRYRVYGPCGTGA
jgi:hypothetical protein